VRPVESSGDTPTVIDARDVPPRSPAVFDDPRFVPTVELGRGGMGMVYRCREIGMQREVAVKVRSESLDSDGARAQFLSEAQLQGRLQHPAIVPVYRLDRTVDGREFFVMREIEGVTLRSVLEGPRTRADVTFSRHALLAAFSRVCMAIDYCHREGVLHRDLKPENVMLGSFGEIYVLDWGLAIDDLATQRPAGTPAYSAPEQLSGAATARSDIYSLGRMLLEVIEADNEPPPELVALGTHASDDDPEARPQSARALAAAVDRYLDGERDLELRRRIADAAAHDARAATEQPTAHSRRTALRAAGRALAVDPDHADARAVLRSLLNEPPGPNELPAEVFDESGDNIESAFRGGAVAGVRGFGAILALMPLELAMGVRDLRWFVARTALVVLAMVSCYVFGRQRRIGRVAVVSIFGLTAAVMVTSSLVLGPFITIPSVTILIVAAMSLLNGPRRLVLTLVVAVLMLLAPLMLELVGVLPRSFDVRDNNLIIHARLVNLPAVLTIVYVMVKETIIIVMVAAIFARAREVFTLAEQKVKIHAWQLEQLVPETHQRDDDSSLS
jgi:predicted Ser/Thr protein kinase